MMEEKQEENDSAKFDITYKSLNVNGPSAYFVLVHGLDGNHESFINKRTGSSLQELLSLDFPTCTILTYTYPNKSSHFRPGAPPFDTIRERANNFLSLLSLYITKQKDETSIIFISHSMGGLIVKSALNIASNPNCSEHFIYQQFKGCVFYATPHSGSSIANLYQYLCQWLPYIGPTASISNLRKDDHCLIELMSSFNKIISNHPRYKDKDAATKCILSLIEGQDEPAALRVAVRIVDVESSKCDSPHEKAIHLDYHHTNICKPSNSEDSRYSLLAHFLRQNLNIPYYGQMHGSKKVNTLNIIANTNWNCSVCTFTNMSKHKKCQMCYMGTNKIRPSIVFSDYF